MNGILASALGGLGEAGINVSNQFLADQFAQMKEKRMAEYAAIARQDVAALNEKAAEGAYQRADRPRQELLKASEKPVSVITPDPGEGWLTNEVVDRSPRRLGLLSASLGRPFEAAAFLNVADNDMTESERLAAGQANAVALKGTPQALTPEHAKLLGAQADAAAATPGRIDAQIQAQRDEAARRQRSDDDRIRLGETKAQRDALIGVMRSADADIKGANDRLKALANDPMAGTDNGKAERAQLNQQIMDARAAKRDAQSQLTKLADTGRNGQGGEPQGTPEERREKFFKQEPVIMDAEKLPERFKGAKMDENGYWMKDGEPIQYNGRPVKGDPEKMPHTQGKLEGKYTGPDGRGDERAPLTMQEADASLQSAKAELKKAGMLQARKADPSAYERARAALDEAQRDYDRASELMNDDLRRERGKTRFQNPGNAAYGNPRYNR